MDQLVTGLNNLDADTSNTSSRPSALKFSINTSPARRRCIVPSPTSPATSITDAIMDDAPAARVSRRSNLSKTYPVTPPDHAQPFAPHPTSNYTLDPTMMSNRGESTTSSRHSWDFLESDSSDIELEKLIVAPNSGQNPSLGPAVQHSQRAQMDLQGGGKMQTTNRGRLREPGGERHQLPRILDGTSNHPYHTSDEDNLGTVSRDLGHRNQHLENKEPVTIRIRRENRTSSDAYTTSQDAGPNQCPAQFPSSSEKYSPTVSERGQALTIYQMMLEANQSALEAILRGTDSSQNSGFRAQTLDVSPIGSEHNIIPLTPVRPSRPVSDHGSFITNVLGHSEEVSEQAAAKDLPPETSSVSRRISMHKAENNRSVSSPPAPGRDQKHVNIVPPPIPIRDMPERHLMFPPVRTPFPLPALADPRNVSIALSPQLPLQHERSPTSKKQHYSQSSGHASYISSDTVRASAAEVFIFVRRRYSRAGREMACIVIPQESRLSESTSPSAVGKNERRFLGLDFDDAELLKQMNKHYYHSFLGENAAARLWRRTASARVLRCIRMSSLNLGSYSKDSYTTSDQWPADILERDLLRLFHKPRLAKGRYTLVQWARQVISFASSHHRSEEAAPRVPFAQRLFDESEITAKKERAIGLEFVEGWSTSRILLAFLLVTIAAVAASLLWIFLGPSQLDTTSNGKTYDSRIASRASRLLPGCGLGLLALLLGWTTTGVWMTLSFLTMSPGLNQKLTSQSV